MVFKSTYTNSKPYVPESLSEIYDMLGSMILRAPTFVDETGWFEDRNIETEFRALTDGFDRVRKKLGEQSYTKLIDLAEHAKTLFAADQDDTSGKTEEGRKVLFEIEDVIQEVRSHRAKAKLKDDEGEVSGD